jgi:glyoxylase-like metal-dependent hydrolase (beta-lactamase superfamily II)
MIQTFDLNFLGHPKTIASFLVESGEGPILVESGPHSTLPQLEKELKSAGYSLSDVKNVLLTHIHLDHAGAAWYFAQHGATIYLHPLGMKHMADPSRLYESAKRIYQDEMDKLWGELRPIPPARMVAVGHHETVRIGNLRFRAWHTPGHAVHHIAWQYRKSLFTGDVGGIKIGNGVVVPPCPPPDIDLDAWLTSIEMMLSYHFSALYLTHFGKVTAPKAHLLELRARLTNWINWMRPYIEGEVPEPVIIKRFEKYVRMQLEQGEMTPESLVQYENANPAFMSVWGISRFWRKQLNMY